MDADLRLLNLLAEKPNADLLHWLLREGKLTQKELGDRAGLALPLISRRLGDLENFGLIGRSGPRRAYSALHPAKTSALLQLAAELASDVLARQAAEAEERSQQLKNLGRVKRSEKPEPW